jgi:hypothetical protein
MSRRACAATTDKSHRLPYGAATSFGVIRHRKSGGMRWVVPPYELLPPLIQLSQPITRQLGSRIIDGGFPVGDSMVKLFEQQTKCGQVTFPYRAVVIAI